jgi:hypothetical protein
VLRNARNQGWIDTTSEKRSEFLGWNSAREIAVSNKGKLVAASSAGAGVLLVIAVALVGPALNRTHRDGAKPWSQEGVEATYVGSQIKELDKAYSTLVLSYDLENNSDVDYRLNNAPNILIVSRLKSDGSLSQEQLIRLSYPVFVPARQHAHLAIEIAEPFAWPAEEDPAFSNKFRDFVRQRLADVEEFVVFDEINHRQLKLPSAWQELQGTEQAEY